VLIHAAAGGVGQAAVQLAQRAGAEVFATASTGKWDFLTRTGLDASHLMNSRTLDFADQIKALTNGEGVEIVLNSLNGEFVDKSFDGASGLTLRVARRRTNKTSWETGQRQGGEGGEGRQQLPNYGWVG
jgi:NADPH-dependent curcumin reductase CurA